MKKNVASQVIGAQMVSATDGSAFTGAVTVYVTGDAGTQAVGSVGSGACTHEGNGFHTYAPAQAETNYDHIGFTFIGSGAVPATVQVFTTFPQTGDAFARIGAPAGASVSADVAAVKAETASILTDTAEIGVAGAGLTVLATAANLATVAGYLDTEIAAILADTNELQTDWANGGRLDLILDARASQTSVDTIDGIVDDILADTAAMPTAAGIADAVWDEVLSGHLTAGSTGNALNAAGAAGDPWTTSLPGAYGAGSAGKIIGDNINATISSRATQTSVDTIDGIVDSILVDTAEIGAAGAGLTALATQASVNTIDGIVDAILLDTAEIGAAGAGLTALATQASVNTIDGIVDAILVDTAEIGAAGAGLTAVTTAVLTTAMTEAYRADGATGTLAQMLYEIIAHLGEASIAGTTKTIKRVDGSTTAATFTLDDATTPTSITRAT